LETEEDAMTALRHSGLAMVAMVAMAAVLVAGAAGQNTSTPGAAPNSGTPAAKSATTSGRETQPAAQTKKQAPAKAAGAQKTTQRTAPRTTPATPSKTKIVVSLQDHKLALIEDGQVKKIYPVAVGKPSTPSPMGTFTIARRVMNPTYAHDGRVVAPGPHNPVGSRWMGLSIAGYGIHGTNEPNSIGKAASHGCIRMAKADLEELYPQVAVGDTVELVGQRDEETAAIFGNPAAPNATEIDTTQLAAAHAPEAANPAHPAANAASPVNVSAAPAAASGSAVAGAL
jgi:lipoprotein-anchoring transpeptidase ErfK/SrfK